MDCIIRSVHEQLAHVLAAVWCICCVHLSAWGEGRRTAVVPPRLFSLVLMKKTHSIIVTGLIE